MARAWSRGRGRGWALSRAPRMPLDRGIRPLHHRAGRRLLPHRDEPVRRPCGLRRGAVRHRPRFGPPRRPHRHHVGPAAEHGDPTEHLRPREAALGVSVDVSSGRVAASTLVVSERDGIGSVLAAMAPSDRITLLTSSGAGQSDLAVMVPSPGEGAADPSSPSPVGELGATFSATLDRAMRPSRPAVSPSRRRSRLGRRLPRDHHDGVGDRRGGSRGPPSSRPSGRSASAGTGRHRRVGGTGRIVDRHAIHRRGTCEAGAPGVESGEREATVSIQRPAFRRDRRGDHDHRGARGRRRRPRPFLIEAGRASILLRSEGSPIVALGASTSLGNEGLSLFGLASGVPIPVAEAP